MSNGIWLDITYRYPIDAYPIIVSIICYTPLESLAGMEEFKDGYLFDFG